MKFILSAILIVFPFLVFAQQTVYTGNIIDENGKALQGATIAVKNTTTKTLSTINGNFSINAEKGGYLEINFSGYKSMSILLGNDTSISVQMKVNTSDVEEVVVIGSRRLPRSKIESTVPVDVIDIKTIIIVHLPILQMAIVLEPNLTFVGKGKKFIFICFSHL